MEIKDLAGLSEPITRLIEVISKGIGAVTQPYLIRKNADARAYEIKRIADALGDVAKTNNLPVVYKDGAIELWQKPEDQTLILEAKPSEERAHLRLDYQERKRQANIEHVTSVAASELQDESEVPNESPDEDWVTRFFNSAKDVSSEEMQHLWGRILAGEIKQPGSYSLRTLDFIRNLTAKDAKQIEKLGKFAFDHSGVTFVDSQNKDWLEKSRGIHAMDQFALVELDAMYPTELQIRSFQHESIKQEVFVCGDHLVLIDRGEITSEVNSRIWKFTSIGREIMHLAPKPLDKEYLTQFGRIFTKRKGKATIAKITARLPNGQLKYDVVEQIADT